MTRRHTAAANRTEIVDGVAVAWCAFCRRNVIRKSRIQRNGLHSHLTGRAVHGDLVRESVTA